MVNKKADINTLQPFIEKSLTPLKSLNIHLSIKHINHDTIGHVSYIRSVAFSKDSNYIATGSMDHTAIIWDTSTGVSINILKGHSRDILSVVFSPCGNYLLTGSGDHSAKLWDFKAGKLIKTFYGHKNGIPSAVFSPCGKYILTRS